MLQESAKHIQTRSITHTPPLLPSAALLLVVANEAVQALSWRLLPFLALLLIYSEV